MKTPSRSRATTTTPVTLDGANLARGLTFLSRCDADLARVIEEFGTPALWAREPGFATLVRIILGQQVSLAAADAAYERLLIIASPLDPENFLALDDTALRAAGFSRQKVVYCRHLATSIVSGELDLKAVARMSDEAAREELMKIKGVGQWTADIYLLMALRRPDVWPGGDLALAIAAQEVKRLDARPTVPELDEMAEAWRPWRALAARVLWNHYLHTRSVTKAGASGKEATRAAGVI